MEDSPLSEVEITDPGVLRAEFIISKEKISSKKYDYAYEVTFYDRNGDAVQLLNGAVYINGKKLTPSTRHTLFSSYPYYHLGGTVKYKLDSAYVYTVMLSDGAEYLTTVTTQKQDLVSDKVAISNGRAVISWVGDHVNPMEVSYTLSDSPDTSDHGMSSSLYFTPANDSSKATIEMGRYRKINYDLKTTRRAIVNPRFRAGSSAVSVIIL